MGFLTIFLLPQLPGGTHLPPEESCFELRFHLSTVAVLWLVPHISVRCVSGHKERVCLKNNLTKQLCFELSGTKCAQKEECLWQVTDCAGGVALLVPRDCTKVAKSVLGVIWGTVSLLMPWVWLLAPVWRHERTPWEWCWGWDPVQAVWGWCFLRALNTGERQRKTPMPGCDSQWTPCSWVSSAGACRCGDVSVPLTRGSRVCSQSTWADISSSINRAWCRVLTAPGKWELTRALEHPWQGLAHCSPAYTSLCSAGLAQKGLGFGAEVCQSSSSWPDGCKASVSIRQENVPPHSLSFPIASFLPASCRYLHVPKPSSHLLHWFYRPVHIHGGTASLGDPATCLSPLPQLRRGDLNKYQHLQNHHLLPDLEPGLWVMGCLWGWLGTGGTEHTTFLGCNCLFFL